MKKAWQCSIVISPDPSERMLPELRMKVRAVGGCDRVDSSSDVSPRDAIVVVQLTAPTLAA
jgi:hypothetical protein